MSLLLADRAACYILSKKFEGNIFMNCFHLLDNYSFLEALADSETAISVDSANVLAHVHKSYVKKN